MMRLSAILGLAVLTPQASAQDLSRHADSFAPALGFEVPLEDGMARGWRSPQPGTVSVDHQVVHSGNAAGRLGRDIESEGYFSSLSASIPIDFGGKSIELRGAVRMEDVVGYAGLWMRTDSLTSPLEFDSMHRHNLGGTRPWSEYRIQVHLTPDARKLVFGAILSGTGTVWVDDLKLFVDGIAIREAPQITRELSVLETDQQFDQGSGVTIDALTEAQVGNLLLLAKVWGFLKYHHPRIARGELHWDYELFRILPAILEAADQTERNSALTAWVQRLGEPAPCEPCARLPEDAQLEPDVDWIRDTSILGDVLARYLEDVYQNRFAEGNQFYVETNAPVVPHPVFTNELPYRRIELDAGYRLLGLFRFWNLIEYWFPYRDIIGEPWDEVLEDLIPAFAMAESVDDYTLAVHLLLARINDTHSDLYGDDRMLPPRGKCQLPVAMRFVGRQAIVAAYSNDEKGPASGLQIGDVLLEIDGVAATDLLNEWMPYYSASNEPTRLRKIAMHMTRGPCEAAHLRLLRGKERIKTTAARIPLQEIDRFLMYTQDRDGETFQWLTDDVAYLKLSTIADSDVEGYIRQVQDARGLIVDLRSYPKEFVVFALGGHLVTEPMAFAAITEPDLSNPSAFIWLFRPSLQPLAPHYGGKVVALVNEVTQSQAEYTAMALRAAPNVSIVGSTTAGTDGNLSKVTLPGSLDTGLTGLGIFYPDGSPTQRVGIVPDIFVTPSVDGIRSGRDELLERALQEILGDDLDKQAVQEIARSR